MILWTLRKRVIWVVTFLAYLPA